MLYTTDTDSEKNSSARIGQQQIYACQCIKRVRIQIKWINSCSMHNLSLIHETIMPYSLNHKITCNIGPFKRRRRGNGQFQKEEAKLYSYYYVLIAKCITLHHHFSLLKMINKAGNLRWGNGRTWTHSVQVKRLDPAFALPTKPRGRHNIAYLSTNRHNHDSKITCVWISVIRILYIRCIQYYITWSDSMF